MNIEEQALAAYDDLVKRQRTEGEAKVRVMKAEACRQSATSWSKLGLGERGSEASDWKSDGLTAWLPGVWKTQQRLDGHVSQDLVARWSRERFLYLRAGRSYFLIRSLIDVGRALRGVAADGEDEAWEALI